MIRQILRVLLLLGALPAMAHAQETNGTIQESEWVAYKERFVAENGRVIDDANGRISHSEGQGYGLLLALLANDRADFARIWTFTNTRLLLRDDGVLQLDDPVERWVPELAGLPLATADSPPPTLRHLRRSPRPPAPRSPPPPQLPNPISYSKSKRLEPKSFLLR